MDYSSRTRGDTGAAAVELALIAPFLILSLLGAIDFGWLYAEHLDARHGAREAGRLAATNWDPTTAPDDAPSIVAAACAFMDNDAGTTVTMTMPGGSDVGNDLLVTVKRPAESATGLLDWAVPDSLTLTGTATFRLETTPKSWNDVTDSPCPP